MNMENQNEAADGRSALTAELGYSRKIEELISERDIWRDSAVDAQVKVDDLKQHLRAVLEICRVWEPDYSSGMDRRTLALAHEAERSA